MIITTELLAFPTGIALIGLGASLRCRTRTSAATTTARSTARPVDVIPARWAPGR